MAEHGLDDVLAVVFDGAGYGPDNTVWGGEFLRVDQEGYQRLGHLGCFQLPGGDAAAREPWRVAMSPCSNAPITVSCRPDCRRHVNLFQLTSNQYSCR